MWVEEEQALASSHASLSFCLPRFTYIALNLNQSILEFVKFTYFGKYLEEDLSAYSYHRELHPWEMLQKTFVYLTSK